MTTVLLHGFTGDPRVFDALAARLEGRVVRPRLPGHGPAPEPVRPWLVEVAGLAAWLEAEGVRDAHLVGYSLGGRLGWHLLHRDDLFRRATLIGAHPGLPDADARAARREADRAWIEQLESDGLDPFVDAWESLDLWSSQRDLPPAELAAQRAIRRSHTAAGLAGALRHLGLGQMPPAPPPRVPVQLVVGDLDARHRAIAESLPHPTTVVPGVGHNVVLEAPGALAERLR